MRILVKYQPNPQYYKEYDEDGNEQYVPDLSGEFVYDLDKMKAYLAADEDNYYGSHEVEQIIAWLANTSMYGDLGTSEKFSLFDTEWEREQVLSDDQDITTVDAEVDVWLNL